MGRRGMMPLWPRMGKTMRVERAAFLAAFGRSQRLRGCAAAQVLGHRREAPARWAVARSAKRPEGGPRNERWARPAPSATIERAKTEAACSQGSVSPTGCCAKRKATRRCEQIQGLCAAAHRTPIFARAAKRVVGADGGKRCGWNEPRFLRPLAARNACEVVLRHRFWDAAPNPGRGLRPLHPALDPPAPPSPQFFNAYILKVIRDNLLRRAARLRHAIGAPLAHAHAMAIARAGHHELALLRAQAGDEG